MAHLIPVGNSLAVRIPKAIISQVGFEKNTTLAFKVTEQGLLLTPIRSIREGWREAFEMEQKGRKEDLLIDDTLTNEFDRDEWQ